MTCFQPTNRLWGGNTKEKRNNGREDNFYGCNGVVVHVFADDHSRMDYRISRTCANHRVTSYGCYFGMDERIYMREKTQIIITCGSSNGRTVAFEAMNRGSSPLPQTK